MATAALTAHMHHAIESVAVTVCRSKMSLTPEDQQRILKLVRPPTGWLVLTPDCLSG